ncbi:MAG: hypothetical protein ACFB6S_06535 [Geminicoccaceae bacterium]
MPAVSNRMNRRAIVVFSGQTELRFLRWLRPGFRHCFVLVQDSEGWICCDWIKGRLVVDFLGHHDLAFLVTHYVRQGCRVVPTVASAHNAAPAAWPRALSCVEVTKQVIGISSCFPITPLGLYRHLVEQPQTLK